MVVAYVSERFKSKKEFKRAVQSGRRPILVQKPVDPLSAPPEPGPFTGEVTVLQPGGFLSPTWIAKAEAQDGVVVRVR